MVDLAIRAAEPHDAEEILRFWRIAAEATDRHDTAEGIAALIRRDPQALVVAEADGRLVGSVIVGWDGWRLHLYRLAVHPEARRQGIGRALLAAAESRGCSLGAARLDAMVLDHNELGRSIWAAAGYQEQPQWSRWVRPIT
jgi:ribosomal protein S18 acetylase RimI-like enzyme